MKPDLPIDTQILWLAAELVEKGHCKQHFQEDESFCAMGAIREGAFRLGATKNMHRQALYRLSFKLGRSIVDWNDDPSRTAAEVALALRTA